MRGRWRKLALTGLATLAVGIAVACGDQGPHSGPGTLTATVVSPNGTEGSAVLSLFGEGIGEVRALDGAVFSERRGDSVRVVVLADTPGSLRFLVAVDDTTRPVTASFIQVADGEDQLRTSLGGYTVEFRP
ncbi:MAG: hypothetical protein PVJ02_04370 [Gemmatimonadota bacterium]|jgi:hypothetical protein